jgi:hypothetical protein
MAWWPVVPEVVSAMPGDAGALSVLIGRHPPLYGGYNKPDHVAAGDGLVFTASNQIIWVVDPRTGRTERLASATLRGPFGSIAGLALDGRGGLLIADERDDHVIRLELATGSIDTFVAVPRPRAITCIGDRTFVVAERDLIFEIDRGFTEASHYAGERDHEPRDGFVQWAGFRAISALCGHRGALWAADSHGLRRIDLDDDKVTTVVFSRWSNYTGLASDGEYLYAGNGRSIDRVAPDGTASKLAEHVHRVGAMAYDAGAVVFIREHTTLNRMDPATGAISELALPAEHLEAYRSLVGMVSLGGSRIALAIGAPPTIALLDVATGERDEIAVGDARRLESLAFDGGDRLYACNRDGVWCIALGSRSVYRITAIASGDEPAGIAVGPPDRIYASLTAKQRIVAVDLEREAVDVIAGAKSPRQLAYDDRNHWLYVGDLGIARLNLTTHAYTVVAAHPLVGFADGPPGVANVRAERLVVGPDGDVYFSDMTTVRRMSAATGVVTTIVGRFEHHELVLGELPGTIGHAGPLCFLPDGTLAVADTNHSVVLRVRLPR